MNKSEKLKILINEINYAKKQIKKLEEQIQFFELLKANLECMNIKDNCIVYYTKNNKLIKHK